MIKLGRAYLHKKTGNEYLVQNIGKMKLSECWVPSVSYLDSKGNMYTRSKESFINSFRLI